MATMSFYVFVAGGLSLLFAFALHVTHATILAAARAVPTPPRLAGAGADRGSITVSDDRRPGDMAGSFALAGTWLAAILLGSSMVLRSIIVWRGPRGHKVEVSVALALRVVVGGLFLCRRVPIR